MNRGKSSILFRYLPESYVTYGHLITKVKEWDTKELLDINKNKLLKRVRTRIDGFVINKHPISQDDYVILTPTSVKVELDPLTMYCKKCRAAYEFTSLEDMNRRTYGKFRCVKKECNGALTQLPFLYICSCGLNRSLKVWRCREHGDAHIYFSKGSSDDVGTWSWECRYPGCGKSGNLNYWHKDCESPSVKKNEEGNIPASALRPKPATASSVFYPVTVTMVNIEDEEDIITNANWEQIVIAKYLGILDSRNLSMWALFSEKDFKDSAELDRLKDSLKKAGLDDKAIQGVIKDYKKPQKDEIISIVNGYFSDDIDFIKNMGLDVLDFLLTFDNEAIKQKQRIVTDIDTEINLTVGDKKIKFQEGRKMLDKIAVDKLFLVNDLSLVNAVLGYTRESSEPDKAVLMSFPSIKEHVPIYANKSETEGLLLTLNRKKILTWLKKNGVNITCEDNELARKIWFLRRIKTNKTMGLANISEKEVETKWVYRLLHSISHALLMKAADLCGIDKDSLGEMIFPNIPAILIYSKNAAKLGGMATLFETEVKNWIEKAMERVEECIYDPLCMEDKGACHFCLFISEVSCERVNKELGRQYIIGGKVNKEQEVLGFWQKEFLDSIS